VPCHKHYQFLTDFFASFQWEDRLYGAGACALVGILFSFMASVAVWSLDYTSFGEPALIKTPLCFCGPPRVPIGVKHVIITVIVILFIIITGLYYTCANVASIACSLFFRGPMAQLQSMGESHRLE